MAIVDSLRSLLNEPEARSFQLAGEDLALIGGPALREAAARYEEELLRTVPAPLREAREEELSAVMGEAHRWLRRYNRALPARVRGYLALGARCRFEYPWPVVAIVGLSAVMTGFSRWRLYGLVGDALARVGAAGLSNFAYTMDDVLLRTNRGIFADSVPTVLLALRAHELRVTGRVDLGDALLAGPLPAIMDEESRAIALAIRDALAIGDGAARFARLAEVTQRHFAREQAIFTYQMGRSGGSRVPRARDGVFARVTRVRSVDAPRIVAGRRGLSLVFRPYALPAGFEMGDHDARVLHFDRAFVQSLTRTLAEYHAAMRYVGKRFGVELERELPEFAEGGMVTGR
jgi:hypothetical protein